MFYFFPGSSPVSFLAFVYYELRAKDHPLEAETVLLHTSLWPLHEVNMPTFQVPLEKVGGSVVLLGEGLIEQG